MNGDNFSCSELLEIILDNTYEGVVVVNKEAKITKMNRAYKNFLGVKDKDIIGQPVTNIIENTRMHIAVQTGIAEREKIQEIQGQKMVVHRIPMFQNNEVCGAIGINIFEGVSDLYQILDNVSKLVRPSNSPDRCDEDPDESPLTFEPIIGESNLLVECKSMARRAAKTKATVLITGESGTGKELFAKAIYQLSSFADGPFTSVNCAAIPENLLESELFGYEEGAFTGAKRNGKIGKFEQADNGTLFLDEIGDMPIHMQTKILRVLQEKEIEKVGSNKKKKINVRIIAATNQNLEQMVNKGTFRKDLYYRLNVINLNIPPIRERKADLPILITHYLNKFCKEYGFLTKSLTQPAAEKLISYHWPGNVREIINVSERLVTLVEDDMIHFDDLPDDIKQYGFRKPPLLADAHRSLDFKKDKLENEKAMIETVLGRVNGNKSKAAAILGIHRSTLYKKLKRHDDYVEKRRH